MAQDASQITQRLVTETLAVPGLDQQLEELAVQELHLWRSDISLLQIDPAGTSAT